MPPPGMSEFIGDKPESARLAQLKADREALAQRTQPSRPPATPLERRADAFTVYRRGSNPGRVLGPAEVRRISTRNVRRNVRRRPSNASCAANARSSALAAPKNPLPPFHEAAPSPPSDFGDGQLTYVEAESATYEAAKQQAEAQIPEGSIAIAIRTV